ncbi:MAG: SDR family oxidoreductase [Crocosphaera sp.]|nr:SDR family oxidoreductase [Crocosphaera sp.]MCH2247406.1 SDR family oxidoreductase [Crocosphaera sp.]
MYNSVDSPFDENAPKLDMAYLQQRLLQQAQSRPLYENIAILGCGYVGSALAAYWEDQGHFLTGTTTSRERADLLGEIVSKVVLMKGNDATAMQSLVEGQDTVVVSVAPRGSGVADEATYKATYLATARNLVQASLQAPRLKQIIYLSSCSVYGDRQGALVDENSLIFPLEARSQVLHEAEEIISQAASDNKRVCILRLGGIYGPGRELLGMFGGLAGMTLPGRGDRFINWIHRDDILGAIEFARLNQLQGVYNVVDDSQLTVHQQVERICFKYGLPPVHWDSEQVSQGRKSLRVSNGKLKEVGYQLIHPTILY